MLPSTLAGIKCLTAQASANCSKIFKYYKDNISPVAPCVSVGGGGGGGGDSGGKGSGGKGGGGSGGGPIGSGTPDACYMLCLFVVHLPFEAWLSIKRIQKGRIILIAKVAVS